MYTPPRSAAAMTISPAWATTSLPSTVMVTVSVATSTKRTPPFLDVHHELVAEQAQRRHHGRRDRRTERADRGHVGRPLGRPGDVRRDVVADVHEEVEVLRATVAGLEAPHDLLEPSAPLATRGALAARFPVEETHQTPRCAHRARRVVEDDDRAGSHHRSALRLHLALVEREVDLVRTEPERRGATGYERLELAASTDSTAELGVVDEVAKCVLPQLDLVCAGTVDPPRHREYAGAGRRLGAQGGEGVSTVQHDPGDVGHRLDVVDDGRRSVQPYGGGVVGGLDAGEAPLALEALQEGGLVTAYVRPRPRVHDQVDREARAEYLPPDHPAAVGLLHGLGHALEPQRELPAHVDEDLGCSDGVGGDEAALDDLVRDLLDEEVVLERRRLALVAVDDQVDGLGLAQHRPLASGREPRPTPPEQVGPVDFVHDLLAGHRQGLVEGLVPAVRQVRLERPGLGHSEPAGHDGRHVGGHRASPSPRPPPPADSPTALVTRLRVPWGGTSPASSPARSRATRLSKPSRVTSPKNRQFTARQGARPQSAMHSTSSSVKSPSAVVVPGRTPREASACSSSS